MFAYLCSSPIMNFLLWNLGLFPRLHARIDLCSIQEESIEKIETYPRILSYDHYYIILKEQNCDNHLCRKGNRSPPGRRNGHFFNDLFNRSRFLNSLRPSSSSAHCSLFPVLFIRCDTQKSDRPFRQYLGKFRPLLMGTKAAGIDQVQTRSGTISTSSSWFRGSSVVIRS